MSCYIAIEGFQVSRRYVIKEMTVLFDSNCYQHFHFNCPIDLIIGPRDWNTIRWQQNNSGLMLQDDSYLPYEMVSYIFSRLLHLRIYTVGNQSTTTLLYFMPQADIVDICQEWDFKYPTRRLPVLDEAQLQILLIEQGKDHQDSCANLSNKGLNIIYYYIIFF